MSEAERWTRVKEIFDAVGRRSRRRPRRRSSVIMCGDDRALQADVESLLAADAGSGSVFEQSVDRAMRGRVFEAVAGVLDHRRPRSRRASVSDLTRSPDSSAPAAWARSIGPATRRSAATSRSRSCPISGWPIPTVARASSARRACWRRSTIPTSGRFTASTRASLRQAQGWRSKRSSWSWSKARRSPTVSRATPQPSTGAGCPSTRS